MNKTFEYGFGKIAVTSSNLKTSGPDMKFMSMVDITECVESEYTSTMDQEELGEFIEFLQEVRNEMIEIDKKGGAK
ncbi:hypothetical protein FKQ51_20280 [Bacillus toyonensis]|uniref:hypothetical protein n=1 Tax=Bacillus toyonensis TaxID=155322 RepID=UPI00271073F6|nr:hypothetical protein [Bacillus toyonensis]MDO8159648.1 hypothetical protein [Bacillus toyonensis]